MSLSPEHQAIFDTVDWTPLLAHPPYTLECRCGAIWRAHNKLKVIDGVIYSVAHSPCPGCGEQIDNVRAARSDPETQTLRG